MRWKLSEKMTVSRSYHLLVDLRTVVRNLLNDNLNTNFASLEKDNLKHYEDWGSQSLDLLVDRNADHIHFEWHHNWNKKDRKLKGEIKIQCCDVKIQCRMSSTACLSIHLRFDNKNSARNSVSIDEKNLMMSSDVIKIFPSAGIEFCKSLPKMFFFPYVKKY